MSEPDAVIHTEDLTKVYQGTDFAAVDKLNLDVQAGEIFGLLGPNGAGKTTTAGMLTTRVVPTSGRAFIAGVDVAAHPALAKQLSGIVSQQNTLDRQLTVWENLYFHGRLFGMGAKASKQTADQLLDQFQLSRWTKASVYALSGGMARLAELLAQDVEGVTRTRVADDKLELHMQGADRLVPRIVLAAEREGFDLVDVSIAEPTLETVFISLTGKELRD